MNARLSPAPSCMSGGSAHDIARLLGSAVDLRRSAIAGTPQHMLRGKNIALLTPSADRPAAKVAARAARALGAQVVHVQPDSLPPVNDPAFTETASVLGRLYDAVIAEEVPPDVLQRIAATTDRPVLTDIASEGHALRALADAMTRLDGVTDHHNWLLQALLVRAMT